MMNFISRLRNSASTYESVGWHDSQTAPGVRFAVRKVSLGRRIELVRQVRELCLRHEFLRAGDTTEQSEATVGDLLVRKLYLEWGLAGLEGLSIDGQAATVDTFIQTGPEELADEVVERIRHELGLTEQERKNF
jgi:hypothetical protein